VGELVSEATDNSETSDLQLPHTKHYRALYGGVICGSLISHTGVFSDKKVFSYLTRLIIGVFI